VFRLLAQGGLVIYPLALCSLLSVAVLVERLWLFWRADRDPQELVARARAALAQGSNPHPKWPDAPAPGVRAVAAVIRHRELPWAEVEERVQAALSAESLRLGAHLSIVGTIGNISPFIGLFGTVLGIIRAFRDIGQVGAAGPAVVAAGISEALVATAAGLAVAITSVIIYNVFITWQSRLLKRAELTASEVMDLVVRGS
jgi:biopolymer transport protein ExbB/TolQ